MDVLEKLLLKSIVSQKRFIDVLYRSIEFDYGQAFEDYAKEVGKDCDELTKVERQRAVMDAVLKE